MLWASLLATLALLQRSSVRLLCGRLDQRWPLAFGLVVDRRLTCCDTSEVNPIAPCFALLDGHTVLPRGRYQSIIERDQGDRLVGAFTVLCGDGAFPRPPCQCRRNLNG